VAPAADDALGASTLLDGDRGDGAGRTGEERSSRRRRLRWLAGGALAVAVLAVVLLGSGSGGHRASDTGVPAGDTTASVTRRTLSESSTVDGTLGYGTTLELYDRLAGTFTWLPSVGAVIGRGGTLWRIDDQPVVLMYGSVPAYRTLEQGVSDGPDVTQLSQNLIDLGFDPYEAIVDDESFNAATAAAVRRWQHAEGLTETGEVELGRIVFAPGARRVTAMKVALGQDPPGEEEPAIEAPISDGKRPREDVVERQVPKTPAINGHEPKDLVPKEPTSNQKRLEKPAPTNSRSNNPPSNNPPPKKPSSKKPSSNKPSSDKPASDKPSSNPSNSKTPVSNPSAPKDPTAKDEPEGGANAGEIVLSTTSTQQIVQLKMKPEEQQLAWLGETVTVQLPGGGEAHGHITQVGTVASESSDSGDEGKDSPSGESSESTIPVTITLDRHVAHLDEAPVSVELVKGIRREVLTVPATALIATAGGGYAVEALEQDRRVTVPVTPGIFADGYVQVEGAGVREGMTVIESQ
jgi:peptidoglycan hydrolase-like protein with peptidoglycan-binding domain